MSATIDGSGVELDVEGGWELCKGVDRAGEFEVGGGALVVDGDESVHAAAEGQYPSL